MNEELYVDRICDKGSKIMYFIRIHLYYNCSCDIITRHSLIWKLELTDIKLSQYTFSRSKTLASYMYYTLVLRNKNIDIIITTRNIGFSYKTFRGNFLRVCFVRISDEIFVGKHMSVKGGPLYTKRWGVAACDWLLLPRKTFLGKTRPHMQRN